VNRCRIQSSISMTHAATFRLNPNRNSTIPTLRRLQSAIIHSLYINTCLHTSINRDTHLLSIRSLRHATTMTTRRSTPTPSYQGAPGGPTGGVPRPAPNAPYNPGADTATYKDLLLFEERLKMNAEMLRRRRRRYNGECGSSQVQWGWVRE
jgi:hypothetical protein